jgi:hypothetical protein
MVASTPMPGVVVIDATVAASGVGLHLKMIQSK